MLIYGRKSGKKILRLTMRTQQQMAYTDVLEDILQEAWKVRKDNPMRLKIGLRQAKNDEIIQKSLWY